MNDKDVHDYVYSLMKAELNTDRIWLSYLLRRYALKERSYETVLRILYVIQVISAIYGFYNGNSSSRLATENLPQGMGMALALSQQTWLLH